MSGSSTTARTPPRLTFSAQPFVSKPVDRTSTRSDDSRRAPPAWRRGARTSCSGLEGGGFSCVTVKNQELTVAWQGPEEHRGASCRRPSILTLGRGSAYGSSCAEPFLSGYVCINPE